MAAGPGALTRVPPGDLGLRNNPALLFCSLSTEDASLAVEKSQAQVLARKLVAVRLGHGKY